MPSSGLDRPERWSRRLLVLSWALPVGAWAALRLGGVSPGGDLEAQVLLGVLPVVFLSLLARLALAAVGQPERRVALGALAVGVLLWAAGAAVISVSSSGAAPAYSSPGEWLFLGAYLGFAAFLVTDRAGGPAAARSAWLDAAVVVGGTACLAVGVLVGPLAQALGGRPQEIALALLYPLLDLVLVLLVVAQASLGQRTARQAAGLCLGFLLLAAADATLVLDAVDEHHDFGTTLDLLWCVGFLVVVGASCPRTGTSSTTVPRTGPGTLPVVLAAALALLMLLVHPAGQLRLVVDVLAVLTLTAVGLRLVLALRAAHQVGEALRLSRTDDLTGLPNRRELTHRLQAEAERPGPLSLVLLDLDGFKEVNDTLGHSAGDLALTVIARRVSASTGHGGLAVRLGGDEFAMLLHEDDGLRLLDRALRLRDVVRKPVRVDGLDVSLDVSIGIATLEAGGSVTDLLRRADVAMYQAKQRGGGAMLYDSSSDDFSRERLRIAEDLRRGLDGGEVVVRYQPKVDSRTGEPRGVEALVRWNHPTDGLLAPGVFLPSARRSGLMPALTLTVVDRVARDVNAWRRQGLDVSAAINLAPAELLSPTVMADLLGIVRSLRVEPGSLVLEVTEESFIGDPDRARQVILEVRAAGIEVSIDDYGTGFSSLAYLRDLPVQELKIDRAFVSAMGDTRNRMIVRTAHELAAGLGLRTVAEGVEDEQTAQILRGIGVDVLQGYHFSRPLPASEVRAWILGRRGMAVTG